MKLKKLLALLLALSMMLALAACGSSSDDADEEDATEETEETEEAADDTEEDDDADAEEEAESGESAEIDELTIEFSTAFYETETGGHLVQTFVDYVEEYSGGAITVDVTWGGTLFSNTDILDGISSGAVDMTTFSHSLHTATLNYLAFPSFAPGGTGAALQYFDDIVFNNEETAAIINSELEENNIIFLSVLAGGANAYCTTYEFTDLDSMIAGSATFGNSDAAIFEYLGFNVTDPGEISDVYSGLENGLFDATQMGLAPMYSMSWYEQAEYWALDGTYTAGNFLTANLDWWNSLTEAQQEVIQAAATATEEYSAGYYDDDIDSTIAAIEESTGHAFVEFSDEDIARIWEATFIAKADSAMSNAEANGKAEGMLTILEYAAELTDYDWTYEG